MTTSECMGCLVDCDICNGSVEDAWMNAVVQRKERIFGRADIVHGCVMM